MSDNSLIIIIIIIIAVLLIGILLLVPIGNTKKVDVALDNSVQQERKAREVENNINIV